MKHLRCVLSAVATLAITTAFAEAQGPPPQAERSATARPSNQQPPNPPGLAIKLARNLRIGDVIAVGNRINRAPGRRQDGCQVNVGVETPWVSTGSYTIDLRADEDCVLRVNSIVDHTDAVTTPQARLTERPIGGLATFLQRVNDWLVPRVSAVSGPKRVTGYTWMYGYGGTWDMLSEERGYHDFSWDGTNAFTNAAYGYCEAHNSTLWWNNGCWIYAYQYNGTELYRKDYGSFFWAPAGVGGTHYYNHQDWNQRNMDRFGNANCSGWYVGDIVYGVAVHCDVAMPPPCGVGVICFTVAPH